MKLLEILEILCPTSFGRSDCLPVHVFIHRRIQKIASYRSLPKLVHVTCCVTCYDIILLSTIKLFLFPNGVLGVKRETVPDGLSAFSKYTRQMIHLDGSLRGSSHPRCHFFREVVSISLSLHPGGGGGGYSQKNWVGVCGPLPKTLTQFMTKICDFPLPYL